MKIRLVDGATGRDDPGWVRHLQYDSSISIADIEVWFCCQVNGYLGRP
jgi:hypothetical protein